MLTVFDVCTTMKYDKYIWVSNQYADLSIAMYKNSSLVFLMILKGNKNYLAQEIILKDFVYKQIKTSQYFSIKNIPFGL